MKYILLWVWFISVASCAGGEISEKSRVLIAKEDKGLFDKAGLKVLRGKNNKSCIELVLKPIEKVETHPLISEEYFFLLESLYKLGLSMHAEFVLGSNSVVELKGVCFFSGSEKKGGGLGEPYMKWPCSEFAPAEKDCLELTPLIKYTLGYLSKYVKETNSSNVVGEKLVRELEVFEDVRLEREIKGVSSSDSMPMFPSDECIVKKYSGNDLNVQGIYMKCNRKSVKFFSYFGYNKDAMKLDSLIKGDEEKNRRPSRRGIKDFGCIFLEGCKQGEDKDEVITLIDEVSDFNERNASYFIEEENIAPLQKVTEGKNDDNLPDIVKIIRRYVYEVIEIKRNKINGNACEVICLQEDDFKDPLRYRVYSCLSAGLWSGDFLKDKSLHEKYKLIMRGWRLQDKSKGRKPFDFDVANFVSSTPDKSSMGVWRETFKFNSLNEWEEKCQLLSESVKQKIEVINLEWANNYDSNDSDFKGAFNSLPSSTLKYYLRDLCAFLLWADTGHDKTWDHSAWIQQVEDSDPEHDQLLPPCDPILSVCDTEYTYEFALCSDSPVERDWQEVLVMMIEKVFLNLNIRLTDNSGQRLNFPTFVVGLADSAIARYKKNNLIQVVGHEEENVAGDQQSHVTMPFIENIKLLDSLGLVGLVKSLQVLSDQHGKLAERSAGLSKEIEKKESDLTTLKEAMQKTQNLLRKEKKLLAECQAHPKPATLSYNALLSEGHGVNTEGGSVSHTEVVCGYPARARPTKRLANSWAIPQQRKNPRIQTLADVEKMNSSPGFTYAVGSSEWCDEQLMPGMPPTTHYALNSESEEEQDNKLFSWDKESVSAYLFGEDEVSHHDEDDPYLGSHL